MGVGKNPSSQEREEAAANRQYLMKRLNLPAEPHVLRQRHGCRVVSATDEFRLAQADASVCFNNQGVCTILSADCIPVLFCSESGDRVAAAHAGWKGLLYGVLRQTVAALDCPAHQLLCWLGPGIGPTAFEVRADVRDPFIRKDPQNTEEFTPFTAQSWLANLYGLCRRELLLLGLEHVFGGDLCTYSDAYRFYSYRRDGASGRMASLIWRS